MKQLRNGSGYGGSGTKTTGKVVVISEITTHSELRTQDSESLISELCVLHSELGGLVRSGNPHLRLRDINQSGSYTLTQNLSTTRVLPPVPRHHQRPTGLPGPFDYHNGPGSAQAAWSSIRCKISVTGCALQFNSGSGPSLAPALNIVSSTLGTVTNNTGIRGSVSMGRRVDGSGDNQYPGREQRVYRWTARKDVQNCLVQNNSFDMPTGDRAPGSISSWGRTTGSSAIRWMGSGTAWRPPTEWQRRWDCCGDESGDLIQNNTVSNLTDAGIETTELVTNTQIIGNTIRNAGAAELAVGGTAVSGAIWSLETASRMRRAYCSMSGMGTCRR